MEEEIVLIYKIENKKRIKIFGKEFVENNKNKCKIKIKEKIIELNEYYEINENDKKNKYKILFFKFRRNI